MNNGFLMKMSHGCFFVDIRIAEMLELNNAALQTPAFCACLNPNQSRAGLTTNNKAAKQLVILFLSYLIF